MLKYLIIQLDNSSPSFCHYRERVTTPGLIDLESLKAGLRWSMKENLIVQFIYPDYALPSEYYLAINSVDHADIASLPTSDVKKLNNSEILILNSWEDADQYPYENGRSYILRTEYNSFITNHGILHKIFRKVDRLNVVFTDVVTFTDSDLTSYSETLDRIGESIIAEYKKGRIVQFNLLTDRILLKRMNNCNAGVESISLCPDGRFYICPGFYGDMSDSIGDLKSGPKILNHQLYCIDHAPICRNCDAWQCKRCVWLNKRLTMEVNTPGRQQCVMSHVERNASQKLLAKLKALGGIFESITIPEIDYLDPFDKINNPRNEKRSRKRDK